MLLENTTICFSILFCPLWYDKKRWVVIERALVKKDSMPTMPAIKAYIP